MGEGGGVNKAAAPDFETCSAHTHTHTHTHQRNRMPDEKNIYLKRVHILENVVNICIINDLSYPPWVTRKYTVRRYQQHHWVVKLPSWGNLYVSIVWEGCFSYKICNRTTLEYIDLIHIMRFGSYKLREFYRRWMKQTYKIRPVGFFYFYSKIKNTGEIRENI